jgi:SAM-dependent methyltransferase
LTERQDALQGATVRSAEELAALRSDQDAIHGVVAHHTKLLVALQATQDVLRHTIARQENEVSALRLRLDTVGSIASPQPPPIGLSEDADIYAAREMQLAAVRCLPFLPQDIRVSPEAIEIEGFAGATEGLIANMAFFVNGHRINKVTFPIEDAVLKARFAYVSGVGTVFRARMTDNLNELLSARFLRFDASATGVYVPSAWRQAIHFMNPFVECFPVPPEANMMRVIGDTSSSRFRMGGAMTYKNIEHYLAELGYTWSDFPRILDWGCGAGRISRYLISESGSEVTGADIDPDNIAWCSSVYTQGIFTTFPLRPPVSFSDSHFDIVIGVSVMTHLQEDDQHHWLAELRRITRAGGLILLSVRGPTMFAYGDFPPALYRELQTKGYIDNCRDGALDAVVEDLEYYRSAMHSRPYITKVWGEYFEVMAVVDAIAGVQDFVVMRNTKAA